MAVNVQIIIVCDVTPCSRVEILTQSNASAFTYTRLQGGDTPQNASKLQK